MKKGSLYQTQSYGVKEQNVLKLYLQTQKRKKSKKKMS